MSWFVLLRVYRSLHVERNGFDKEPADLYHVSKQFSEMLYYVYGISLW